MNFGVFGVSIQVFCEFPDQFGVACCANYVRDQLKISMLRRYALTMMIEALNFFSTKIQDVK